MTEHKHRPQKKAGLSPDTAWHLDPAQLRQRAEQEAKARGLKDADSLSPEEVRRLLHELQVNQIELEMQNGELRRTQQELEASWARYFDLYDLAPVGYCTLSEEGLILEANLTLATQLGVARNALAWQPLSKFVFREDEDTFYFHRQRLFETGEPQRCEIRMARKDGELFWARLETTRAEDEAGAPVCRLVMSDITERQRVEEMLRINEERFRMAQSVSHSGNWEYNLQKAEFWGSDEAKRIYGFDPEQTNFTTEEVENCIPERERVHQALIDLIESNKPYDLVFEIHPLNSTASRFISSVAEQRKDKEGNPLVVGVIQDITERKRAEKALRESEERFRQLAETMSDAVLVGQDGRNVYANAAAARLLRAAGPEELVGLDVFAFIAPTNHEWSRQQMQLALAGENLPPFEDRFVRLDGSSVPVEIAVSLLAWQGRPALQVVVRDVTERKRAEEALRESEEKHRTLFESMAQGVVYQNAEGHIISANPAAERVLGLTLAQMLGRTSLDPRWKAIHEDGSDFPGDTHPCMIALKTGKEVSHVVMGVFHPGANEYVWINIHAVPQFRPGETKPYQVYTTFDDITGRKRTEEALRQSKENFEALAESANEGILIATGEEGRHVYANRRALEITGYPIEELLKTCIRDLAHPEELAKIAERYKERLEGVEVPTPYETAFLNKHGIKIPIEISPSRTIWQNQLADMVMFRDITERKHAEEAVHRASAYNRSLIEASLDPLVTIAPDGKITDVNNATEKVTGLSRQQLIGTDFADCFTDPGKARAGYERVFREGLVQDYEVEIRHRDGRVTPVLYNAAVYRDEAGVVIGVFAAARDINPRKRAEEERQSYLEQLRALAGRLQDIREEERKQVARDVHDQLGQALVAIKFDLYSLGRELAGDPHQTAERVASVLRMVDEAIQSVHRVSTELRPPMLDHLGLVATVEWAGEDFESRTGTKCKLHLPEGDLAIDSGKATALYRILQELLTNVAQHAAATEVEIELARGDKDVVLTVRDNGKGMPVEKFSAKESLGILGMQERALAFGGELILCSAPGAGTTVQVRIPH